MLRGLYISATGMLTQRKAMDVLTNNLANLETAGYKGDTLTTRSFSDVLVSCMSGDGTYSVGRLNYGIHPDEVVTDFTQGGLESTGRTADLALAGDGFFVVETPQGLRFTRSGNFQVNQDGYLCTQEGYFVRGTAGRMQVGSQDFSVDMSGNVSSASGTFKLQIVKFADNGVLRKAGGNVYTGPATAQAANCSVVQGALEGSNVELAGEMVDMISVQRNYEANQKMITMINGTLEKTVNEVGRV